MTVGELIDALGGRISVSEQLAVVPSAVSNWRRLGAIPPQYAIRLMDICLAQGIDWDRNLFRQLTDAERGTWRSDRS